MKKLLYLLVVILILPQVSEGQWIQRKYNVENINQLSTEQLKDAYGKTKSKVWTGAIFTYFGTVSLITGMTIKTSTKSTRGPEGEGQAYKQAFLVLGSVCEIVGLPLLLSNYPRLKSIKRALKNTEISIEPFNDQPFFVKNNRIGAIPILTVKINF